MKTSVIKVSALQKNYGDNLAVNNISFEVAKGTILGMLGPNGAGKTTTIQMLIGLLEKTDGTIDILGLDPAKDMAKLKQKIGVQLQSGALFTKLTIKEILELYASFYENPLEVGEVIQMVGLEEKAKSRVHTLSGGQQRRLEIALALITNAEIFFLDEPTTGLDPKSRRDLWDTLLGLKKLGKTIFLTTHYMDEAEVLSDNIIIIDKGKIIAEGTPNNLIAEHLGGSIIKFESIGFNKDELEKLKHIEGVNQIDLSDNFVTIFTDNYSSTITSLLAFTKKIDKDIVDLQFRKPTLEDLFIKLTGKGFNDESV